MDTRRKIVTPELALQSSAHLRAQFPITLVVGHFDVLQPALLRRLEALSKPVFALVLDPPNALLPSAARIELAASLRMIDYVIHWAGDSEEFVASLAPNACLHEEAAHSESTERLIQHVFERHGRSFERRRQN
jgi:hypothetical protein